MVWNRYFVMNKIFLILSILALNSICRAESFFIQYSLGATQDYNNQTIQTLQRSFFHEASFYYRMFKNQELYIGLSYSMSSTYQTDSTSSSSTQIGNSPLVSVRYYLNKKQYMGLTFQYGPMAQLYQASEAAEINWTGSMLAVKPGIYLPLSKSFQLAIEFSYFMTNYTKTSTISGSTTDSSFTRTQAIPSAGLIWNF